MSTAHIIILLYLVLRSVFRVTAIGMTYKVTAERTAWFVMINAVIAVLLVWG